MAQKQKAPVKSKLRTRKEMLDRLNWYVGKYIDFDNAYQYQCMDVAVDYIWFLTKGEIKAWGNAKDLIKNNYNGLFEIFENTPDFLPKVGDIVVYTKDFADNDYGHVALVYANPTLKSMVVVEQNWNDLANMPCTLRTDYYAGATHFIRLKI